MDEAYAELNTDNELGEDDEYPLPLELSLAFGKLRMPNSAVR